MTDDRNAVGNRPAMRLAGLPRERDQPQTIEHPPRNGQQSRIRQMVEVIVERLDRVERILRQRVGAGRCCGPCVHQRRLNHVVPFARSPDEAAAVVDGNADSRVRVDAAGKLAKPAAHDVVGDDRIDLDAVNVAGHYASD